MDNPKNQFSYPIISSVHQARQPENYSNPDFSHSVFCMGIKLGVEQNRKQRFPVNSITSKLVLKSIYASGSTGPFFDNHFMNKHDSSFAKKTDFLSRYLVLSEIRCARKKSNQKQEQNLLSKVFNLFEIFEIAEQEFLLDSLLSA